MLNKTIRRKITAWLAIHIGTPLLNLWFSTCRIHIQGMETHWRFHEGGEKVVAGTWHRGAVFMVWYYRRLHPLILFSRSRDGELIAAFAEKLGAVPIRGSTSRGGREALRDMLKYMDQSGRRQSGTVLDGPRGPRFVAQKGMLFLAKHAGVPLQPVMFSAHPAITLKNTWDRTIIPLPFSRVLVSYREPIRVPRNAGGAEMEKLRVKLQTTLNRMMVEADAQTGYKDANPDVYADYFEAG